MSLFFLRKIAAISSSFHATGVNWSRRKLDAIGVDEVRALHAAVGREGQRIQANRVIELLSAIYNDARWSPS